MLGVNRSCVSTEVLFIPQQVLGKKSVSGRNWSSFCLSFFHPYLHSWCFLPSKQADSHAGPFTLLSPVFVSLFKTLSQKPPHGEACWRLLDHVSEEQSASSYLLLPEWSMPVAMWWADLMRSNTWIQDLMSVQQKLILTGRGKSSLPMTSIEI